MASAWPGGHWDLRSASMEQCLIFKKFSTLHIRIYPSMFVSVVIIACIVRPSQKTLLRKLLKNWRLTSSCMCTMYNVCTCQCTCIDVLHERQTCVCYV